MSKQKATTYFTKETTERAWQHIDAEGETLGRLATRIASILRGKNKAEFTPNQDCGDFVVVTNVDKMTVSGKKMSQKLYYKHSGVPGHLKQETLANLMARRPEEVLRKAVKGMLPHNRLSDKLIVKLKLYAGDKHPHEAQLAA
jgi:large subunit ribosomal protein L13